MCVQSAAHCFFPRSDQRVVYEPEVYLDPIYSPYHLSFGRLHALGRLRDYA